MYHLHGDYHYGINKTDLDVSFLTIPEGCPYSDFNDPPFPPNIERIVIDFPEFNDIDGRILPQPNFVNFVSGTNLTACLILTVIDDDDFEGAELFNISVVETGPDFYLTISPERGSGLITIRDPEGTYNLAHLEMWLNCYSI